MNSLWIGIGSLRGGRYSPELIRPSLADGAFPKVTLPHGVAELFWRNWDVADWHGLWVYRRHFDLPHEIRGGRVFVRFGGVMVGVTPIVNGHRLDQHLGGYLPSRYEITDWVKSMGNILVAIVDSRWSNVPPEGAKVGPKRIDYLEPGGIHRPVSLEVVPQVYIDDVFAKPVKVLDRDRRIDVRCSIDAGDALAKSLDDSRATSGSMTPGSMKTWKEQWDQDVFAYDEYAADGIDSVRIQDPLPGVPYTLAEVVGQFNYTEQKQFSNKYRRAGDLVLQRKQALYHAQAHDKALGKERMCGVIAWCAFDYASLINSYDGVKCPGVADIFRIPKLGAAVYQSQGDPQKRALIVPNFFWDFGTATPTGPGKAVAVFSNCDRLELFVDGRHRDTLYPDSKTYPNLKHPPFFADLEMDGIARPELRIDGYLGDKRVLSESWFPDTSQDRFYAKTDDGELVADGTDATRLEFGVTDKFGHMRLFAGGQVSFELKGPGILVGDNPFDPEPSVGVGAVWIKTSPNAPGKIAVRATHATLGSRTARIKTVVGER